MAANRDQSGRFNPARPPATTSSGGPAVAAIQIFSRRPFFVAGSNVSSRMKNVISTGTMVIASTAEAAMAKVLV